MQLFLDGFRRRWNEFNFNCLRAKHRVLGAKARGSGLFLGANPDCASAADERKGIISDDFGRPVECELNGVVCKWADGAVLVGNTKDDARGVGAVRKEPGIVGHEGEFLVDAAAGERLGDSFVAADVALDAQVAPVVDGVAQVGHKGCVFQMRKLLPVGIRFRDELIADIELQVVAI